MATLLEALTVIALAPAVVRHRPPARPPLLARWTRRSTAAAVSAIALITAFGVAGADDHAHTAGHLAPAPINVAASARDR